MRHIVTILLLAVVGTSAALATNGIKMIGFSAKSVGVGGASIGTFDGTVLMMTNPGGLGFLNGPAVDVNFSLMIPSLKFSNGANAETKGETNYFPLPGLAYAHADAESPFAWGIGAFTQGGMGADFTLNNPLFRDQNGAYVGQEYHSKLAVMEGGLSAAYRFTDNLSIGFSAHLVYSTLEFKMPYSLAPSIMQGIAQPGMTFGQMFAAPPAAGGFGYTEVTALAAMTDLTAFGFCGKVGLAYKVNDRISFGISYTSASPLTYKNGKATMDMTAQLNDAFGKAVQGYMAANPSATQVQAQQAIATQFGGMGIDLSKGVVANYDLETKLKMPQSVGAGMSFKATDRLRLAMDVEWVNWSSAFDKMSLSLSNGSNANINTMLGNSGALTLEFPMNWKDAVNVRLGLEYELIPAVVVRGGYAYGKNPVPESTVFPVFPAIVENHVMVGASWNITSFVGLHVAYEIALNSKETASNPSTIAQEYNGSVSQLLENIIHASLSWSLK
ncbi:MAG: outer membrane protein transport protein [Bacteroidota bacterium]